MGSCPTFRQEEGKIRCVSGSQTALRSDPRHDGGVTVGSEVLSNWRLYVRQVPGGGTMSPPAPDDHGTGWTYGWHTYYIDHRWTSRGVLSTCSQRP